MRAIALSIPPHVFIKQGRYKATPRFFAACEVTDFAFVAVMA
jgi:hypothetical protein